MKKRNLFLTFLDGIYLKNPILSLFLGLTLAVLVTTNVQASVYLGAIVLVVLVVVELFCSLFRKFLGKILSYVLAAILSASLSCIAVMLLSAYYPIVAIEGVGGFANVLIVSLIPFVSTTSAVLVKGEKATELGFGHALFDALGSGIGFILALALIAFFRELLGTGELVWTLDAERQLFVHVMDFTLPFILNPFGGFVMTGLVAGFHASICRAFEGRKKKGMPAMEGGQR